MQNVRKAAVPLAVRAAPARVPAAVTRGARERVAAHAAAAVRAAAAEIARAVAVTTVGRPVRRRAEIAARKRAGAAVQIPVRQPVR